MKQSLRVLHIEDSKEDSDLIKQILRSEGLPCDISRVETRSQVFDALQSEPIDIILADCRLPNFSGLHALEIAHALKPDVPFIFVSGTIGEETAIESLRNGATDYVLKDHLARLGPAVRRALSEAEERMLFQQLHHRLREAARLEAIGTLSSGIAHDFNNILTIILGHASLLTLEHKRPDRVLELTETIKQAAQRGSDVVEQLLAFARKSDGHLEIADLNRCLQDQVSLLKDKLPPQITLSFEPFVDLPPLMVDANQVERILLNLITNSVESMPNGGRITLSTRLVPATDVPDLLPVLASENYACLSLSDTGSGIDPRTKDHIFEPFFTTKARGRGTGLGLPVVYGLMQAHNGCVEVESEPGQGTTVSLYFPVPRPSQPQPPPSVEAEPALCGSETILVVEDETDVSFFLETILQSHGYQVVSAHSYDEAVTVFQEKRDQIHLVFSDIGLPKVDGITLCAKLKSHQPDIPIILASGYSQKDFKPRMDELCNQAFLSKPYNTQEILQCVRSVLDGSRKMAAA